LQHFFLNCCHILANIFIFKVKFPQLNDRLAMDFHIDFANEEQRTTLLKVAEGDQAAFKTLYLFFHPKLLHFATAMVKTREAGEEIVEDVFIKIWRNRENLPQVKNIRVYLYSAVKNTALNYISKKARESVVQPFDNIDIDIKECQDPEKILITAEMFSRLQKAVECLAPRCKMIFKLIRQDGLKYREVAEILNISVNTIDAQMAIAVKKIAAALQYEIEPLKEIRKFKTLDKPS